MKEYIKKSIVSLVVLIVSVGSLNADIALSTSLAPNDPLPVYNAADPHAFMFTQRKEKICGCKCYCGYDRFSLSLSPYYQKATQARTFDKERVPLGDMRGRWNMLGLLYGPRPNQTMPPCNPSDQSLPRFCNNEQLCCAQKAIFPEITRQMPMSFTSACQTDSLMSCTQLIPDQDVLFDPLERIGFFSVPSKYRKVGMRFEFSFRLFENIGLTVQTGVADLKQTLTEFVDLTQPSGVMCDFATTCSACGFTQAKIETIEKELMCTPKACEIFNEIGLDICDFHETGIEDTYIGLWWRHPFCINRCADDWPEFAFTPFLMMEGSVPTAKKVDRRKAFALPLGNDGHATAGFRAGFDIDFKETIAIGLEAGFTHFFERDVSNVRVPTHQKQSGVFPWTVETAKIQPGNNGHFGAGFHAYRFLDRLSFSLLYLYLSHQRDELTIPDTAPPPFDTPDRRKFSENLFNKMTDFVSQMINANFTYDISPNMTLGLLVQAPVSQRNAFRSTTIMGMFQVLL